MAKKVLFISSWYPNRLEPQNGNFVKRHAEAAALLNDVEVLHAIGDPGLKSKYSFEETQENEVRTLTVFYRNTASPLLNFYRRMSAYRKGFSRMNRPQIIHGSVMHNNLLFAVYLKNKLKIPLVISEHWTALQAENHGKTGILIKKIAKSIGNRADYILPVSENLKKSLQLLGIKTPMQVIGNVVDTDIFRLKKSAAEPPKKFLHISSLVPRKNPDIIIKTAIRLHREGFPQKLEIGGDANTDPLVTLVAEQDAAEYIRVFGMLDYKEVAKKMQSHDCFVLFSENETQGCVLLESFACGKPVIATKVGGVPEIVQPGFGILVPEGDAEALYEAMKSLMLGEITFKKPEIMHGYVEDNFSAPSISRRFDEIYNRVLR